MNTKYEVFFSRGMDKIPGNARKLGKKAKQVIIPIANALKEYSKIIKGINTVLYVSWKDFFFGEKRIRYFSNNDFIDKQLVLFFDAIYWATVSLTTVGYGYLLNK